MLVHNFLENSAARLADKVALISKGCRLSYQEVNARAEQLARYLVDVGIQRRDRVIIFLDNSIESIVSLFGILKAGAIFIILNPTMKAHKLHYILRDSGARMLIAHTQKKRVIKDALLDVPELEHILWCQTDPSRDLPQFDSLTSPLKSYASWSSVFEHLSTATFPKTIDLDLATIIYTSGSTGEPKGVMCAHYNVVAAATSITQYLENVEHDIILNALPLSFDYGLYQVLMAFLFGGTLVQEKSFAYPYNILKKIIEERATGFPIVPTMVAILLQMHDLSRFDLSCLRYITNTAAALPVSYIREFQALFPHVQIYSMYGLTECKRTLYLPPEQLKQRPGSVGIAIPNEEVFIVNEDGQELGAEEIGELVVRGNNVMQGYWNAPEETARVYRPGRYRGEALLYTSDFFRKDEEGFFYFVARKDDLIKTKGERVSPKEIEDALCEIDGVVEAAVIGVPEEIIGQAIKAFVVTRGAHELTDQAIERHCAHSLEPFMIPKYVEFIEALPRNPNGKIDKKQLH